MHYNVAFWTSITVVKMSYYAALTDCKKEQSSSYMFIMFIMKYYKNTTKAA